VSGTCLTGPAVLTSPTPGNTFAGTSATFTWTFGGGATAYDLYLGTTGVGSSNLYRSGHITTTSTTVSSLPANGETIYARIFTYVNGTWVYFDSTYTATMPAVLTSPTPGSTFTGTSVTFTWTAASGDAAYDLYLGTTGVGSNNLYRSGHLTTTSTTPNNIPTSGQTIYARILTELNGTWVYSESTYTAASLAVLTSPTPGSTLTGTGLTFTSRTGN
jgi:hypothetical protein